MHTMMEAARVVATLVPGLVDERTELVRWDNFDREAYERLSTGERAAYDLARELWTGGGTLPRFLAYADEVFASRLLSAVHLALSPVWFPARTARTR